MVMQSEGAESECEGTMGMRTDLPFPSETSVKQAEVLYNPSHY